MEIDKRFEATSVVTLYNIHRQTVLREVRDKMDKILTEPTPACPNCHLVPIIWDEEYGTVCRCQFCGATVQVNKKGNLTRVVK